MKTDGRRPTMTATVHFERQHTAGRLAGYFRAALAGR
jgi:hypothetical protein